MTRTRKQRTYIVAKYTKIMHINGYTIFLDHLGCEMPRMIEYRDVLARAVIVKVFVPSLLNCLFDGHNVLWDYFTIELPRYLGIQIK